MDCPGCGRRLPEGKGRCIYCGALAPGAMVASGEVGGGPGEDRVHEEAGNVSRVRGELKGGSGIQDLLHEAPDQDRDDRMLLPFAMQKSRRPKPMNRVVLLLIFFASAAVMGALVWLMG